MMRILSGIQPSGKLHIGNYFGMMRPALDLQEQGDAYLFIADYHALTSVADAEAMRQGTRDVALDFLACGLDPERTAFYRQSDMPEVHELAWLLSNVTPLGLLERCHSYKDKLAKGIAPNHGLLAYPVLMAAENSSDIGQLPSAQGSSGREHTDLPQPSQERLPAKSAPPCRSRRRPPLTRRLRTTLHRP